MDGPIVTILAITAGITASLAVLLVVVKLIHRGVQHHRGLRTAYYVAAIGEMLSRQLLPSRPRQGWAEDPYFHEALADYRLMVTGKDREFVDDLIRLLGIDDVLIRRTRVGRLRTVRLRALSSLVDLATPAYRNVFLSMIDDRNAHVRVNAVRGLARIGDVASVPHILDIATRVQQWEAARTADALIEMGRPCVGPVIEWIETERAKATPSVEVVGLAARLLGLIGENEAEGTLISLLGSSVPEWRVAAASALEHAGTEASVSPLRLALHDDDWRVRARAVVALGATADPDVVVEVAQLLTDRNWWVRQNAATSLARLPGGTDCLFAALDSPDPYAADAALNQLTTSGAMTARTATTGS